MATTKLNIGLAISHNFNKVTLEMLDEPVEYENNEELKKEVRKRFDLLRGEVEEEFKKIHEKR